MNVLIVEDEIKVQNLIKQGLKTAGIDSDAAGSLEEMFVQLEESVYDAMILDRLLHGSDSLPKIAQLKKKYPSMHIIILSALSDVDEKVDGLSGGADDYLGKPFQIKELVARLHALSRRGGKSEADKNHTLKFGDIVVNLDSQSVERQGKRLDLTAKEFKLLVYLMREPGKIATKSELIDSVWELQYHPESNIVEVLVNHLRSKIDKGFDQPLIHSKRGTGYWFGEKKA